MTVLAAAALALAVALTWPGSGRGLARLGPSTTRARRRPSRTVRFSRPGEVRRRRVLEARRTAVVEFIGALGAEVRAGRPPRAAVVAALAEPLPGDRLGGDRPGDRPGGDPGTGAAWPGEVRAAAAAGDDVAAALVRGAAEPGAADLRDVAACWEVAERTGAGLGGALDQVGAAAGERVLHQARVRAQLAGVRTTGWLLAALPLVGMVLAAAAGARPWRVLLGTPSGLALLTLGVALDAAGVVWLYRLARRVEETL